MFVVEVLVAIAIAVAITALFVWGLRATGPWGSWWWFFLVVLLVAWAAGAWAEPWGPALLGVYWLPFLFFGMIAALLIAASAPAEPREPVRERERTGRTAVPPEAEAAGAAALLTGFFWVLLVVLAIALVAAYL